MKSLKIDFEDKEITTWGGISLFTQMIEHIDFVNVLSNVQLPIQGFNRGYQPEKLILIFLVGV